MLYIGNGIISMERKPERNMVNACMQIDFNEENDKEN
jgi:hypothetical protein